MSGDVFISITVSVPDKILKKLKFILTNLVYKKHLEYNVIGKNNGLSQIYGSKSVIYFCMGIYTFFMLFSYFKGTIRIVKQ